MAIKLPDQPWNEGDSFVVDETGLEYTYNGEVWVSEGKEIDLSGLAEEDHDHNGTYSLEGHNHNSDYLKKGGTQTLDAGRWLLKAPKTDGTGNWSYIDIDGDEIGLYHVKTPTNSEHAANMQYVDDEVAKVGDEVSRVETEVGKIATEVINKSDTTHDHNSSYATKDHEHPNTMKTGTSTNPSLARGELYLNTNNKVVYVGY